MKKSLMLLMLAAKSDPGIYTYDIDIPNMYTFEISRMERYFNTRLADLEGQLKTSTGSILESLESQIAELARQKPGETVNLDSIKNNIASNTELIKVLLDRVQQLEQKTNDKETLVRLSTLTGRIKTLTCNCFITVNGRILFDSSGLPIDTTRLVEGNTVAAPEYTDRSNFLTNQYGEIVGMIGMNSSNEPWTIMEVYDMHWRMQDADLDNGGDRASLYVDGVRIFLDSSYNTDNGRQRLPNNGEPALATNLPESFSGFTQNNGARLVRNAMGRIVGTLMDGLFRRYSGDGEENVLFCKDIPLFRADGNEDCLTVTDLREGASVLLLDSLQASLKPGEYAVVQDMYGRHLGTAYVPLQGLDHTISPPEVFAWNTGSSNGQVLALPNTWADNGSIESYKIGDAFYIKEMPDIFGFRSQYDLDDTGWELLGATVEINSPQTYNEVLINLTPGDEPTSCKVELWQEENSTIIIKVTNLGNNDFVSAEIRNAQIYSKQNPDGGIDFHIVNDGGYNTLISGDMFAKNISYSGNTYGLTNNGNVNLTESLECYLGSSGQSASLVNHNTIKADKIIAVNNRTLWHPDDGSAIVNNGTIEAKDIFAASSTVDGSTIHNLPGKQIAATADIFALATNMDGIGIQNTGDIYAGNIYAESSATTGKEAIANHGGALIQAEYMVHAKSQAGMAALVNSGMLQSTMIMGSCTTSPGILNSSTINTSAQGAIYSRSDNAIGLINHLGGSISTGRIYAHSQDSGIDNRANINASDIYIYTSTLDDSDKIVDNMGIISANIYSINPLGLHYVLNQYGGIVSGGIYGLIADIPISLATVNAGSSSTPSQMSALGFEDKTLSTNSNTGLVRIRGLTQNVNYEAGMNDFVTLIAQKNRFQSYSIKDSSFRKLTLPEAFVTETGHPTEYISRTGPIDVGTGSTRGTINFTGTGPMRIKQDSLGIYILCDTDGVIELTGTLGKNIYANRPIDVSGDVIGNVFSTDDIEVSGNVSGNVYTSAVVTMKTTGFVSKDMYCQSAAFPQARLSGVGGIIYASRLPMIESALDKDWTQFKPRSDNYKFAVSGFIASDTPLEIRDFNSDIVIGTISRNGNLVFAYNENSILDTPIISEVFERNLREQLRSVKYFQS